MRSIIFLLLCAWCCAASKRSVSAVDQPGFISDHAKKFTPGDIIKQLLEKLEKTLMFLCSRCQDIIREIDVAIEGEQLKIDAVRLCETALSIEPLKQMCKTFVIGTLGAVYGELKKFEPKPELCNHIRLCDGCVVNVTRSSVDIVARTPDANPALLIAKVSQLKAALTHFATSEVLSKHPQS